MSTYQMHLGQALESVALVVTRAGRVIPRLPHATDSGLTRKGNIVALRAIESELQAIADNATAALISVRAAEAALAQESGE